ncbi:hypothetical protein KFL_000490050 [Klebsormidium nitens]|uniref:Autophagy-related protein 13 N-terminal domain-containing protein n=1 Tax=Klebsormidium nitens TaxID=105231 RepID=A0A0U9HJ39_KLENI|nr:hypothetical protein KFL_000490050 [Klebsormidium nitens]|eukprot:GAQ80215.1 hypothetical protein KFL_000490050 [Klebsormidium nitens]
MASQSERARMDQIVSEFYAKSLHIILGSRIPSVSRLSGSASSVRNSSNRWFNLELDTSEAISDLAEPWRRGAAEPMIVDVLLQQPGAHGWSEPPSPTGRGSSPSSSYGRGSPMSDEGPRSPSGTSTLLERWVIHYERRRRSSSSDGLEGLADAADDTSGPGLLAFPGSHNIEVPVVYKRTVILLRSLYAMTRLLPAHRLYRLVKSNPQQRKGGFYLTYRVMSAAPPMPESEMGSMSTSRLSPVDTPSGRISLSVMYRHTTAVTALEVGPSILPRIIADYVGSPTTDPLRRYPPSAYPAPAAGASAVRQGLRVVPLQPTSPLNRRHSIGGSPTSLQRNPNFPPPSSPSSKHHAARFQSPSMRTTSLPPQTSSPIPISRGGPSAGFAHPPSPSPSPSPPPHHQDVSAHYARSASAPVSIPRPPARANSMAPVHTSSSSGAHSHRDRSLSSGDQPFGGNALSGTSPSQSAPQRYPQFTRSKSEKMGVPRGDLPGSGTPPLPRPWTASSPPKWQPSSAPSGPAFPESWGPGTRPSTPGLRTPGPDYLSTPGSEASGPMLSFSPPLPFACTPRPPSFSGLSKTSGSSTSERSAGRATPPISGRDSSALQLARYPSFSMSMDPKAAARASISPVTESPHSMSPPQHYLVMNRALLDERGGFPAGLKRSLYHPGRATLSTAMPLDDDLEDEADLPFAVDDVESDSQRKTRIESSSAWPTSPAHLAATQSASHGSDAAVGALVRILKSAAPLRSHPSSAGSSPAHPASLPSSSGAFGTSPGGGMVGARFSSVTSPIRSAAAGRTTPPGGVQRQWEEGGGEARHTVAEALEELQGFSVMRDGLLRQRGEHGSSRGDSYGRGMDPRASAGEPGVRRAGSLSPRGLPHGGASIPRPTVLIR